MKAKPKILFVMQLPPPIHGVSVMSAIIHNSPLIKENFDCYFLNSGLANSIKNLQRRSFSKIFSSIGIVTRLFGLLIARRYQKVYITFFPYGSGFWKDSVLIGLCKLFGYKPLLHLHTYGFRKSSDSSAFRKKMYRFLFKETEPICLSRRLTEDIENLYSGKVNILPNGIPRVNDQNTYHSAQGTLQLLFLSNLIKGKGILIIMHAMKILREKNCNVHLRVVGEEFDVTYAQLNDIIKKFDLENFVNLVGPKYGDEKYKEISSAGVLLLPSDYDTFGLVLLEAMQFGVPCIASNIGAMPEVLSEGSGLIMPELSAECLADKIIYLVNNPEERKKISRKAFDRYKMNYTSEHFEKNLLAILSGNENRPVKFVNA